MLIPYRPFILLLAVAILGSWGCATVDMPSDDASMLTDEAVRNHIQQRLAADDVTAAQVIHVDVDLGVATLSGSVPDANIRLRALAAARSTPGVGQVVDRIRAW